MATGFPFLKEAVTQLFQKSSCEEYPFKPKVAFDGYRRRLEFHPEKCINCNLCERVCAGGAIHNELVEQTEEGDRIMRTFDLTSCTFCGYCSDFCHEKAIVLSKDFAMVSANHEDLLVKGIYLKKKKPIPAKPAAPKAPAPAANAEAKTPEKPAAPAE